MSLYYTTRVAVLSNFGSICLHFIVLVGESQFYYELAQSMYFMYNFLSRVPDEQVLSQL